MSMVDPICFLFVDRKVNKHFQQRSNDISSINTIKLLGHVILSFGTDQWFCENTEVALQTYIYYFLNGWVVKAAYVCGGIYGIL